jgi:predicted ATPase
MQQYVLTGAPGAGKTSVLGALRDLGFAVVQEAATDVIARAQRRGVDEPWREAGFLDEITALQRRRLQEPVAGRTAAGRPAPTGGTVTSWSVTGSGPEVQVYDRSVLCTLALAWFLGRPVTPLLAAEVARVTRERTFRAPVFLLAPIGFVERTAARRISYADSLAFGRLHEQVYAEHGFEILSVPAGPVAQRAAVIAECISSRPGA